MVAGAYRVGHSELVRPNVCIEKVLFEQYAHIIQCIGRVVHKVVQLAIACNDMLSALVSVLDVDDLRDNFSGSRS